MATCPACKGEFEASYCPRDGNRLIKESTGTLGERYRLVRKVGEGSMGVVYEAQHIHLQRRVAVKLIQSKIADDRDATARFQREARSTTGLGHPNIVDTIDFGFADGQPYLVMEWLDGENLDARMSRDKLDVATALEVAAQACAGLAAAHERGVVHRDLKPANLFLTRDHRGELLVKVLDFGIAKLRLHETKLTATGVLVGTPNYMAPEQAEGNEIDARTDIYALGVMLYEMLTGMVPFQGETPLSVLHQHTSKLPIMPSARAPERGIPEAVDMLVMRCLAKRPDERFGSMQELATAIANARGVPAVTASSAMVPAPTSRNASRAAEPDDDELLAVVGRRRWVVPAAIVAVAAAGVAILWLMRGGTSSTSRDAAVVALAGDARLPSDAAVIAVSPADASRAAPDAGSVANASYTIHGAHFTGTVFVRPDIPIAGQPIEMTVQFGELPQALRAAQAAGRLEATVEIEYWKTDTLVAPKSSHPVDATGMFYLTVPLEHASKHHVYIDLIVDGKEVDHAKVNIFPELP